VTRMMIPDPLKHNQRIRAVKRKISGGAVTNTQAGKDVLCLIVAEALMIIAIVPGPAVLGMASGMKAKLAVSGVPLLEVGVEGCEGGGKSIFKPITISIPPPAIRKPGMEILKIFMMNSPM